MSEATAVLERALEAGVFPGAVARCVWRGDTVVAFAGGRLDVADLAPAVAEETLFDLASVTKIFTSVAVLSLIDRGLVGIDSELGEHLPEMPEDKRRLTVRQLLTHVGGLARGQELQGLHPERGPLRRGIESIPLISEPGTAVAYSSIGYMYLGWMIEAVTGQGLDRFFEETIIGPCGLAHTRFRPPIELRDSIAAAEYRAELGRCVQGVVHDEKSRILGGVTGHAGLFAPAEDVVALGRALIDPAGRLLGESRRLLYEDLTGPLSPRRSAAFIIDDPVFSDWPHPSFSHTGFTGTSLCLVPELDLVAVLLTNRVCPSRDEDRIAGVRTAFHGAVRDLIGASRAGGGSTTPMGRIGGGG
ncbi:MAG TPA: serine hydrolase domain-containing protein [Candidatus Dormibacteraeota bacterium]|jgi:CubicO group peptidase (beta-lactamase class C family)|nr:serine hydrolase domain-containing protein [Candidatus Dormibacteraeota bacterium]